MFPEQIILVGESLNLERKTVEQFPKNRARLWISLGGFWKRQAVTLLIVLVRRFHYPMQFSAGPRVLFHLPVPIVVCDWIKQSGQFTAFFRRELVNSRLNMFYATHD